MSSTPEPSGSNSKVPQIKVGAAGIGGALTTVVIAVVEAAGGSVSATLAAAIATVISFAAGYITPPRGT